MLSSWRRKPQTQIQWVPGEAAALAAARWSAQCEGRAQQRHPAHGDSHCWHATQLSDFRENTLLRAMGWTGNSLSVSADGFTAWTMLMQSSCCQNPRWAGHEYSSCQPRSTEEWMKTECGTKSRLPTHPGGPSTRNWTASHAAQGYADPHISHLCWHKVGNDTEVMGKKVPSNVCTVIRKPPVFCYGLFRMENTPLL